MSYGGSYGGPPSYQGSSQYQGYGGFSPQEPQPPRGADPQLWSWFTSVDKDHSGSISPVELQKALVNGDWSPFDLDTIKLLMNIFDTDRSGTIGFNEFAGLWKYIKDWQGVFLHFDRDRSGTIDGRELEQALNQFGFRLTPQLLALLQRKYDVKGSGSVAAPARGYPAAALPGITFDRFVRACVVVKQLTESFSALDTDRDGWIQLNYEKFLETVLTLP
ncbi:EF-hand [Russula vinacea]|nr:EF-hand [Russula vinacea]